MQSRNPPEGDRRSLAQREKLRLRYRPETIKILFVGESPPAKDTFFYAGDSNLFNYTRKAFGRLTRTTFEHPTSFLDFFQLCGCYLEDVCLEPVNHLEPAPRRAAVHAAIREFSRRIEGVRPVTVIIVKQSIAERVGQAIGEAGLEIADGVYSLPLPTQGHQTGYVCGLKGVLRDLHNRGLWEPAALE